MPIDMPPQAPAYHIERAAPAPTSVFDTILAAAHRVSERTQSPAERMLPQIDSRSQALTEADRNAILDGMTANWNGDLAKGRISVPRSYVGERVALGVAFARMRADPASGIQDARAMRCRMVAVAMDRRAGAYVVGGEQAAAAARRSIPAETIEACRSAATTAQARTAPPAPAVRQVSGRVDPSVTHRVRIDLAPSPRTHVEPRRLSSPVQAARPVAAHIAQGAGRGI